MLCLQVQRIERERTDFHCQLLSRLLEVVVVHLDAKDDDATNECDEVGERDVIICADETLCQKAEGAYGHHDEARQRDAVGVACANGLNGLGEITQHKPNAANKAADVK